VWIDSRNRKEYNPKLCYEFGDHLVGFAARQASVGIFANVSSIYLTKPGGKFATMGTGTASEIRLL
jgi:hypothetical protein